MNITFLKLYRTNELNGIFYNSQEVGLAKALVKLHPEHHVDIILLTKKSEEHKKGVLARKNTGCFGAEIKSVVISENINLHILRQKVLVITG